MAQRRELFKRVLVATDFSDGAAQAVARAAQLPLSRDAQLMLLHVVPLSVPEPRRRQAATDALHELESAAAAASDAANAAGNRHLTVTSQVAGGEPFIEIIRRSRTWCTDLVVIGPHRPRPLRDLLIGSTAASVVRKGDVPVLLVSGKPSGPYGRPLVGMAMEDVAVRLIELVLKATHPKVDVTLVGAYDVRDPQMGEEMTQRMTALVSSVDGKGSMLKPVIREGGAGYVILQQAEEQGADLIVIGTHGRSGFARVLLGSVSEYILERAQCDVLVARPARFSFELP